tara:strand:+ start:1670 stop:2077 length:408 start_codon:yes stop_codon:yes gene_type:complete
MSILNKIQNLPKELQWQILLYTKHPVVEAINKDECYLPIIRLQRDFYDYIQNNMLFFEETEVMDNTNIYFNPDMCMILYKVYLMDMNPREREKTIEIKRMIKRNAYKIYNIYDHDYGENKPRWIRDRSTRRLIRC